MCVLQIEGDQTTQFDWDNPDLGVVSQRPSQSFAGPEGLDRKRKDASVTLNNLRNKTCKDSQKGWRWSWGKIGDLFLLLALISCLILGNLQIF